MSKRKQAKKNKQEIPQAAGSLPATVTLSQDELKKVIAEAIIESKKVIEAETAAELKKQQEADLKEWQAALGIKNKSDACGFKKILWEGLSTLKVYFVLPFVKKSAIKGEHSIFSLLAFGIGTFFTVAQFSVPVIAFLLWRLFIQNQSPISCSSILFLIVLCLGSLLFIGFFRMAKIEVIHIKDKMLLLNLFACIATTVSIIIAIIALLRQ